MIQYDNVADDVSLRYTITAEKAKEEITISSPESPISYSYSFKSYGLEPQFDKSQTLQFVDSNGNAKVIVPAPFVEDANGEVSYQINTDYEINVNTRSTQGSVGGGGADPTTVVNYFYDISGNMLRESDGARQDQYYYYGSNGLTCIYDSKLGVKHSYVRSGLQLLSSSDGFYYIVNGRGDVVALVSNKATTHYNSGDIIGYYVYEPFGGLRAAQKQSTVFNKFKFAGGLQSNTGNYAFGSRIYAPGQGRWISMDAYQGSENDPLSLNRYAYCGNDPVNFVDPSGYFPLAAVPIALKLATLGGAALYTWINANLPIITQYLYLFGDKIAGIVHDLCNSNGGNTGSSSGGLDPGKWGKGSFKSASDSLQRHFEKHGAEVGAKNVAQYLRKAEAFMQNLKGATSYKIDGYTEGVIRYVKNGRYIDLAPDGTIISFGAI